MKRVLINIFALFGLMVLFCSSPEDPFKNPDNASAEFTSINDSDPERLNEVISGNAVTIGFDLKMPDLIDSIVIRILSSQQNIEAEYAFKAPWEKQSLSASIVFPTAGTKTCILTCYKNNGETSDDELIFVAAYRLGNQPPRWSPDTVELFSKKGSSETQNLKIYTNDPDENPISFHITLPNDQFTAEDSLVFSGASLKAGLYPFRVIISDGEMFDTGTVIWQVIEPETEHAIINDDSAQTVSDRQIIIDVLANDHLESGSLLLSSVTQPDNGLVAIKSNKVIYIPAPGFSGTETFQYVVNAIDTGEVRITVTATTTPHPPRIVITGDKTLKPFQTCSLFIEISDEDSGQVLSVSMTETLEGASIIGDSLFIWTIPEDYTGNKILTFKVVDNGIPPSSDSTQVTITVSDESVNNAPHWDSETLSVNLSDTGKYSLQLSTICQDSDGEKTAFSLLNNDLPGDTIIETTYTFNATSAVIGSHIVQIIASDPKDEKDTLVINITVLESTAPDNTPPILELMTPGEDSSSVNASSVIISIEATDESDIASVAASIENTDLQISASKPVYSVTVANLVADQYITIRFIATDASSNGNKETLFVTIKYDPKISDEIGPVFKQVSGPASGSVITDPLVTIVDSITDPSGIDSVFWSLNHAPIKLLTAVSGKSDHYSFTDSLKREDLDTIIVTAVDKSIKRNRSIQTIILNYTIPPVISSQSTSQEVCAGTPVIISVTVSGTAPLSYQWRKGSGEDLTDIAGANDASYSFTPGAADNGTIFSCIVSSSSGISTVSEPIPLTVNSGSTKPTAVATPSIICTGSSSVLSVSAGSLGTGASWKWYTARSSTTALNSTTVSPSVSKWYYVKGTGGSCIDSPWDSVYITVNSQSTAPTGISASASDVCSGNSVTLSQIGGTLGTEATWQWFTDSACTQPAAGMLSADGSQITVTPLSNSIYYVRAAGSCNTTSAVSETVTVSTPSTPPAGIASAVNSVCPGNSVVLSVSGGSLGTGAKWKWYTNSSCTQAAAGTPNANGSQFTVAPSLLTNYYVRAEGSCNITPSASLSISVNVPPTITTPLTDQDICYPGQYSSFSITANGATPFSYHWFNTDGTELGNSQTIGISTETVGSTSLYCIVTDVNGCSVKSNTATVTVHQKTEITLQPELKAGYPGWTYTDSVTATGEGVLNYEWEYQLQNYSWQPLGTGRIVTIQTPLDGYPIGTPYKIPFRCKITNSLGCTIYSDITYLDLFGDI